MAKQGAAYSPELKPIENFWAWLKAKLRRTLANFSCFDDALCYCFKSI
jgi:transposase